MIVAILIPREKNWMYDSHYTQLSR